MAEPTPLVIRQTLAPPKDCQFCVVWIYRGKTWAGTYKMVDGELFEVDQCGNLVNGELYTYPWQEPGCTAKFFYASTEEYSCQIARLLHEKSPTSKR